MQARIISHARHKLKRLFLFLLVYASHSSNHVTLPKRWKKPIKSLLFSVKTIKNKTITKGWLYHWLNRFKHYNLAARFYS